MAELIQTASITEIEARQWNRLLDTDQPFVQHGFLTALETSGSVTASQGWQPAHALLRDDTGELLAGAPLYLKDHSFGEFVFDFAWADAYDRLGLSYYPKLINAVPFSPVVGPRILARDEHARYDMARALARLPEHMGLSSLHSLYGHDATVQAMLGQSARLRRGIQYLWFNRDYADFEDFLSRLSAKRRKEIRRERRRMREAGITVTVRAPDQIDDWLWPVLYAFYQRTYHVRGQQPYLTPDFFRQLKRQLSDQVRFFIAWHDSEPVGMAFMMVSSNTLYGRHWGSADDYHSLHFETCYYAGIEYCIAHGLQCFDAGAQGEHKIRRGFEPCPTWSTHIIAHPRLDRAIGDFVEREAAMLADHEQEQRRRCAFDDSPAAPP